MRDRQTEREGETERGMRDRQTERGERQREE